MYTLQKCSEILSFNAESTQILPAIARIAFNVPDRSSRSVGAYNVKVQAPKYLEQERWYLLGL
jgi:hypothetical protein